MSRKKRRAAPAQQAGAAIMESRDYNRFELLPFNRDVEKIKYLERSMREHGWIPAYPMHVVPNGNGTLKIKAGHHRFTVARKIGVPVQYVVCEDTATIYELERSTNRWTLHDYLVSHVRAGHAEYERVEAFFESHPLTLQNCVSMLGGDTGPSSNRTAAFKAGTYRIKDYEHAEKVARVVQACLNAGIKWAKNTRFASAISYALRVPEVSLRTLIHKIETHTYLMEKQATLAGYLAMLESVYNRQSGSKIPLAFRARTVVSGRNAIKQTGAKA